MTKFGRSIKLYSSKSAFLTVRRYSSLSLSKNVETRYVLRLFRRRIYLKGMFYRCRSFWKQIPHDPRSSRRSCPQLRWQQWCKDVVPHRTLWFRCPLKQTSGRWCWWYGCCIGEEGKARVEEEEYVAVTNLFQTLFIWFLCSSAMPIVVVRQRKAWRRRDGVFLYFEVNTPLDFHLTQTLTLPLPG